MSEESARERVKTAIDWLISNGYATSQRAIAEKMQYNPSTLSLILNGRLGVKERFARTFCSASGGRISQQWLLTGEGEMVNADNVIGEEIKSRMYGVTLEDIVRSRMKLEHAVADACAQFTVDVGIPVNRINVDYKILPGDYILYDVRVPVEIPTLGSTAECKDYRLEERADAPDEDLPLVEFEEAFVSACMEDGSIIGRVKDYLFPGMFSDKKLGTIYGAMVKMVDQGMEITVGNIADCADKFAIDMSVLVRTKGRVASAAHAEFYADCIYNYALRHNPVVWVDEMGLSPKEYTQINPVISEAYRKLQDAALNRGCDN